MFVLLPKWFCRQVHEHKTLPLMTLPVTNPQESVVPIDAPPVWGKASDTSTSWLCFVTLFMDAVFLTHILHISLALGRLCVTWVDEDAWRGNLLKGEAEQLTTAVKLNVMNLSDNRVCRWREMDHWDRSIDEVMSFTANQVSMAFLHWREKWSFADEEVVVTKDQYELL